MSNPLQAMAQLTASYVANVKKELVTNQKREGVASLTVEERKQKLAQLVLYASLLSAGKPKKRMEAFIEEQQTATAQMETTGRVTEAVEGDGRLTRAHVTNETDRIIAAVRDM